MGKFSCGETVRVRAPSGRVTEGQIKEVFENCWWNNTEYIVTYSAEGFEEEIRLTEELLLRHNRGRKKNQDRKPDGLTRSERKRRIKEVKEAIEDFNTMLEIDLESGNAENILSDRHTLQALKNELHALYRKEAYESAGEKNTVHRTYGLGLI